LTWQDHQAQQATGGEPVSSGEEPAGARAAVTLEDVRGHRDAILAIGRRFGVRNVRVFGSVARGDATRHSDLDLLIDVEPGHGYLDMAGFALEVEDLLGVFTQVATEGGLKLRIRDRVLAEAVPV
jgi:predicted nucleotidyltransferase